ncbi:MAG: hypothetical protein ABI977_12105 [Acidobacteriota bacterium]
MKKTKLILTSFLLALMLTFAVGFSSNVYASDGDPQGTSGSTKTPPAPPPPDTLAAILIALASLIW